MFGSFHFGIFVFSYFGHFSSVNFVTSLTKTKNEKWNEINISFSLKIRLKLFTRNKTALKSITEIV